MPYLKELYRSPSLKKNNRQILRDLRRKKPDPSLYVLTISASEHEQLDIYPGAVYRQDNRYLEELLIIGFAFGRAEAYELVAGITEEALASTGSCDIRSYLAGKDRVV